EVAVSRQRPLGTPGRMPVAELTLDLRARAQALTHEQGRLDAAVIGAQALRRIARGNRSADHGGDVVRTARRDRDFRTDGDVCKPRLVAERAGAGDEVGRLDPAEREIEENGGSAAQLAFGREIQPVALP